MLIRTELAAKKHPTGNSYVNHIKSLRQNAALTYLTKYFVMQEWMQEWMQD